MALTFQQQLEEALKRQQPAFRPTAIEGLLNPPQAEIKPYSPSTFEPLLGKATTAEKLGLLGGGFLPGAGMADYMGMYPRAGGGYEPSAQQNWQQGNYITAGMQGLGAMGDVAMTMPVLGAAIGAVAKTPRAVQKGVTGLIEKAFPKVDELGFFSQVEKSVMDIPQQKGTGQQFLAQIQKTAGVKPEELQYTGLDTFLANKPTVTKGEIQDYLDANRVQVQEVTLGGSKQIKPVEQLTDEELADAYRQITDLDVAEDYGADWRNFRDEVEDYITNPELEGNYYDQTDTKFSQYTLPGGENYREVLLTLPTQDQRIASKIGKNKLTLEEGNRYRELENLVRRGEASQSQIDELGGLEQRVADSQAAFAEARKQDTRKDFVSTHFNQRNILAHMRVNDRTIDGKPTLFIEEVQSDWHQAGRKQGYQDQSIRSISEIDKELDSVVNELRSMPDVGYAPTEQDWARYPEITARHDQLVAERSLASQPKTGVPDAPFKSTWDELTLKRAIKMASDEGYDQIAFTTGKTQAERYDLSKQVDHIDYKKVGDDQYTLGIVDKDGQGIDLPKETFTASELEDYIGKEIAQKIVKGEGQAGGGRMTLRNPDLQLGGEGMKGFYDKMLPKKLEKLGKKYGAKPTKSTMQTPDGEVEVWTFNIPKEMRETVKEKGQPLFQIGAGVGLGAGGLLATEDERM